MIPTGQRLKSHNRPARQVDEWLIVDVQLLCGDGIAEVVRQRPALPHGIIHLPLEEATGIPATGLGAVQGDVGIGQQVVGVHRIVGKQRHADARPER